MRKKELNFARLMHVAVCICISIKQFEKYSHYCLAGSSPWGVAKLCSVYSKPRRSKGWQGNRGTRTAQAELGSWRGRGGAGRWEGCVDPAPARAPTHGGRAQGPKSACGQPLPGLASDPSTPAGPRMLLRPRRPPPPAPPLPSPSPARRDSEPRPAGEAPGTPPGRPASPGALAAPASPGSPVSPGSAQRTPWSAHETELLLGTLLQPAVWRALLLDRRRALPIYRRVSAALARQQVRRTPAQCRRRYKFLKDKLRDAHGQPPGPFDAQIRQLMGLLGDDGRKRGRRRSPGHRRGRRPAPGAPPAPAEPGRGAGGWGRAGVPPGPRPG